MTNEIENLIQQIENEVEVGANTKERIGNVLRKISNENKSKVLRVNITTLDDTQTDGNLIVGKKYYIEELASGDDFSNVGYVEDGEIFIATGTTPEIWENGTVVEITGYDINIMENTIDEDLIVEVENISNISLKNIKIISPNDKLTPKLFSQKANMLEFVNQGLVQNRISLQQQPLAAFELFVYE